jgi:hypothetical protein
VRPGDVTLKVAPSAHIRASGDDEPTNANNNEGDDTDNGRALKRARKHTAPLGAVPSQAIAPLRQIAQLAGGKCVLWGFFSGFDWSVGVCVCAGVRLDLLLVTCAQSHYGK